MSETPELTMFLSMLPSQIPVILACVVSFSVILSRTDEEVRGRSWALVGFGLLSVLCVLMPAVQSIALTSLTKSSITSDLRSWIFTGLAVFWSLLRGFAYMCLLLALVARPASSPFSRPSYEPR